MPDKWAASSNEALAVSLVSSAGGTSTFHPMFTYPIFGEEETIYGYTDLNISLSLAAGSLKPALLITYGEKKETNATAEGDKDVQETLLEFLPERNDFVKVGQTSSSSASRKEEQSEIKRLLSEENKAFKPVGAKVATYESSSSLSSSSSSATKGKGKSQAQSTFEIYHCDWDTPGFKELHRRMQIFALLFIEGASYISEEELNWEFFVIYERTTSSTASDAGEEYRFVGYTSLYKFWSYPANSRIRLSQFLVLPTYQAQGHGSKLYETVYQAIAARDAVSELTVEDPSEAFDHLRDRSDLTRLFSTDATTGEGFLRRAKEARKGGALRAPVDKAWSEAERLRHKIAPRQWARLVEMCMLTMLDETDAEQCRQFRLQVRRITLEESCYGSLSRDGKLKNESISD